MTTRKKDGSPYKLCSYLAIRRCLSLIFQFDYGLTHVDISCDPEFLDANVVFSQMSHSLRGREENFGLTESWRLTPEKLKKLYTEGQLDFYNSQNPKVLLQTVYFYVCYYTGIGKLSVMRQVSISDVQEVTENGRLIAFNFDLRKYLPTERGVGPFTIYEIQGKPWCPVLTIREYLTHRNRSVLAFFQKPLAKAQCFGTQVWFKKSRFKDIYPLANMCREANIDPPLTSGCFSKARISAEIRYEMSFIYAKLFPQCFRSSDELQAKVKQNVVKRKRMRKGSHANAQMFLTSGERPSIAISSAPFTSLAANDKNSFNMAEGDAAPPSMVVSRHYQPINHVSANGESQFSQTNEMPTISVANVFSCRKNDHLAAAPQTQDSVNLDKLPTLMSVHSAALENNREANQSPTNIDQLKGTVIAISDDSPEANNGLPQDKSYSGLRDLPQSCYASQETTRNTAVNGETQKKPAEQAPASDSTVHFNRGVAAQPPVHLSLCGENSRYEVPPKRPRFNNTSHTFLREISASAREQGKGAVMLLLTLLDDISNNRGKELLTDILQEMKVI